MTAQRGQRGGGGGGERRRAQSLVRRGRAACHHGKRVGARGRSLGPNCHTNPSRARCCVLRVSRRTRGASSRSRRELVAPCDAAPTLAPGHCMASLFIVTTAVGVSTPLVHRALPKLPSGGQIALEPGPWRTQGAWKERAAWPAAAAFCRWLTEQSDEICGLRVLELGLYRRSRHLRGGPRREARLLTDGGRRASHRC